MTENEIQKAVFQHLRERAFNGAVYWHPPNDKASRRKAGFRAGVSDVNVLHEGKFYAIELKKPGGNATIDQMQFVSDVNSAGGYAFIAHGLDQALKGLELWNIIRPEAG